MNTVGKFFSPFNDSMGKPSNTKPIQVHLFLVLAVASCALHNNGQASLRIVSHKYYIQKCSFSLEKVNSYGKFI